jgi:hypothetical protein
MNKSRLYFRKDPDSNKAYFDIEKGNDLQIGSFLKKDSYYYKFIWQRSKSNENLVHGFTHYLTRHAYGDNFRIVDGNKGMLCILPLNRFGYWNFKHDRPEIVLLLIKQEETQNGRIRLISCRSTKQSSYLKLYVRNFRDKKQFDIKPPDTSDNSLKTIYEDKMNLAKLKSKLLIERFMEEYDYNFLEDLKRGYQIFQKIIGKI